MDHFVDHEIFLETIAHRPKLELKGMRYQENTKILIKCCGGLLASMGQNSFYYIEACELVGKGVKTRLMGSYCRPTYAQARHTQGLDRTESDAAGQASL